MKNFLFIIMVLLGLVMISTALIYPRLIIMNTSNTGKYDVRLLVFVDQWSLVYNIQAVSKIQSTSNSIGFEWDANTIETSLSSYQKTKIILEVDGVRSESPVYSVAHSTWSVGVKIKGLEQGQHHVKADLYIFDEYRGEWILKSTYETSIEV